MGYEQDILGEQKMIDKTIFSLPKVKGTLGLLAGLAILRAVLVCLQGWSLSGAITGLWKGENPANQFTLIAIFFVCFLGRKLLSTGQDKIAYNYSKAQGNQLGHRLLEKVFTLGPELTGKRGSGHVITMALDGISQVEKYLRLILLKMADMAVIPLLILVFVFILDWVSGLILLGVFPLIILFMILLGKAAGYQAKKQYKTFQALSNHFTDSLRGMETLKIFGRGKEHSHSIFSVSESHRKATMKTLTIAFLSGFSLDFFCTLSVAMVALGLGIRLLDGSMTLLPALTVLVLSPEYFLLIREFAGDYHATLEGRNALAAVGEILNIPSLPYEEKTLAPWASTDHLFISNLTFSYGEFTALKNISFEVRGFQKIGIMGMSGCGKTTLIKLLGGFARPQESTIHIQNQWVDSFHLTDWQQQGIYIPQNPTIFHSSLRENIAFYHPLATDEEIFEAVDVVGLETLLTELPQGLDTQIGQSVRPLSGGQAQRIALARALLDKKRRILLFDEPTAHLDIETEVELKEKMLKIMEGRLVFFATHRLHWMQQMDAILVLDKGRVAEFGPPEELMKGKGAYYRMVQQIQN